MSLNRTSCFGWIHRISVFVCGSNSSILKEQFWIEQTLCHKVKGKEWANVHICVISAVIRLNPIHGNELVEQMESLKVIENDAARTVVLVSGLKAGRLASSCLKFKDLSVKFK